MCYQKGDRIVSLAVRSLKLGGWVLAVAGGLAAGGCAQLQHNQAKEHVTRGDAMLEQNDLGAAIREFEQATQLDPQLAVAHSKLGIIYRRMGDYDRAIDCFAEAVRLAPRSFDDTLNLAQLYHFTKRLRDAVEAYLHACALQPNDFDANLNLGVCYQQLDDAGQAVERFQKAIAIDPDRPHAAEHPVPGDASRVIVTRRTSYPRGHFIEPHWHARGQLVYAVEGTMTVRARRRAWIVPPDRALWMPPRTVHEIRTHSAVEMHSLYLNAPASAAMPAASVRRPSSGSPTRNVDAGQSSASNTKGISTACDAPIIPPNAGLLQSNRSWRTSP